MKTVPHSFYLGRDKGIRETYQYSIDYTCDNKAKTVGGYQIAFVYDMASVGIHYRLEEWSLLQLFTSVAAIISGVYVIMDILHNVLSYLVKQ